MESPMSFNIDSRKGLEELLQDFSIGGLRRLERDMTAAGIDPEQIEAAVECAKEWMPDPRDEARRVIEAIERAMHRPMFVKPERETVEVKTVADFIDLVEETITVSHLDALRGFVERHGEHTDLTELKQLLTENRTECIVAAWQQLRAIGEKFRLDGRD
jgi:hypothetical protein